MKLLILIIAATSATAAKPDSCQWCVNEDSSVVKALEKLSAMQPKAQLAAVRSEGVCVKILDSGRKVPNDMFHWAQVETPEGQLSDVTRLKNVLGKSFCKGEHKIAAACPAIALASDAPASTLLHEYLHVKQIAKKTGWCPNTNDKRLVRDMEWDVHRLLWSNRKRLNFNLEDQIAVASETIEEAELRKSFDPTAMGYLKQEKMSETFRKLLIEYSQKTQPKR